MRPDSPAYAPDPAFPLSLEERSLSGDAQLPLAADLTQIIFVRGGSALLRDRQGEILLRRGDILIALKGLSLTQAADFRICALRFRAGVLIAPAGEVRLCPGYQALFAPACSRHALHPEPEAFLLLEGEADRALLEYRRQQPGYRAYLQGYLTTLLVRLCRLQEAQSAPLPAADSVARALAYLEDHYTEEIALPELARISGVSPRHLNRAFQAQCHLTPRAYMTRLRMARAKALLATPRPITEIAFDCGYADSNYFSQVFRRCVGMSPQQYRREGR